MKLEPEVKTMEACLERIFEPQMDIPGAFRIMSEASPLPMAAVAGSGNIIHYVNPAFCILSGRTREILEGSAFSDVIPSTHEFLALLDRVHRTSQAETHIGEPHSPSDSLYWSYAMWPAMTLQGTVAGIVIQVMESQSAHQQSVAINQALVIGGLRQHELTEKAEALNLQLQAEIMDRQRAEENLVRAHRDLEQFTYAAGHDLQEPLRTITSFTQLLERRLSPPQDSETEQFLAYIVKASNRMSALIQDLLAFARIGAEQGENLTGTDCGKALEDALANLSGSIQEVHAVVTAGPLPVITANPLHLTRLFQNLIANSLKYRNTDRTPSIDISAKFNRDEWTISVRDNGIGFQAIYAEQIFGLFKRLHTTRYPGTGIGLALCRRIVEGHRGRIWATGEEGKGATFYFTASGPGQ